MRGLFFQALVILAAALLVWEAAANLNAALERQNLASGFGFFSETAGFGISQTLIEYSEESTYGRAFLVGLLNTVLVAAIGVVLASIFGFLIGIARLSHNWLVSRLAALYIEIIRNVPLLLQIFFWYFAVFNNLPPPRRALSLFGEFYLHNRGAVFPRPVFEEGGGLLLAAFLLALLGAVLISIAARRRREKTGRRFPAFSAGLGLMVFLPLLAFAAAGSVSISRPELTGFNFQGGGAVNREFMALLLALSLYAAAFIAEIVRAGILSVGRGQTEAAYSLGLRRTFTLRFVVIPQAMRVIIPPLTSQYLNLTKNSSLAVAIAYPELVSVFTGTTLNQTGQAVEIVFITMCVYLTFSVATALLMNAYNARINRTRH